jgi:hypothetical protein
MNRLLTMARFAEPDVDKPVGTCDFVKKVDTSIFCSAECVCSAYAHELVL